MDCTRIGCTPGGIADCSSPFDAGECDAIVPVFWFNPDTGACEPQEYGGCGGNDNRYSALGLCRAACGGAPGGVCQVQGVPYTDGSDNVPDPYSCNTCSCDDGRLTACTEIACDEPCPAATSPGASCDRCGSSGACEVTVTGCLLACETDEDCRESLGPFCVVSEGYCANLCG